VFIVGASVGGATAAMTLRAAGIETVMLERELVKPKPCGGAIPPAAFREFDLPQHLIERKVSRCMVVSPSSQQAVFPVVGSVPSDDDYVAMVRREVFDSFLRERAQEHGADLIHGTLIGLEVDRRGVTATYRDPQGNDHTVQADLVIGADGAYSSTARLLGLKPPPRAVAIQERFHLSPAQMEQWEETAAIYLGREVSPDLYAWVFPKHDHVTVGIGTGPSYSRQAKQLLANFKARLGSMLDESQFIMREAHALPMEPHKHMAFDRAMLIGDAAGLVVHTSGEGIYWAMKSGEIAAQVIAQHLDVPTARNLRAYEKRWWRSYGSMYTFLRWLQVWSYSNERQMEVFAEMCRNTDVQRLTFDSYMHKQMAPAPWLSQLRMTHDILISQLRYYMLPHPKARSQHEGELVTA
jgi:geranylgeranyl reductase